VLSLVFDELLQAATANKIVAAQINFFIKLILR
jgi:hypothetical protein